MSSAKMAATLSRGGGGGGGGDLRHIPHLMGFEKPPFVNTFMNYK